MTGWGGQCDKREFTRGARWLRSGSSGGGPSSSSPILRAHRGSAPTSAAGARRHDHQPSPDGRFVVCLDPVRHPFCLREE